MNWFISDTHFNHANIIRYCDRPFDSVSEMNRTLVENWNRTVDKDDTVFFLGDLALGRDSLSWLRMLNGHIVLIRGSHDRFSAPKSLVLHRDGVDLFLVHDPTDVPEGWRGWVVHGHKHNTAPFIDLARRRVNVSVEAINYTPVSVGRVVSVIRACESSLLRPAYARVGSSRGRRKEPFQGRRRKLPLSELQGVMA